MHALLIANTPQSIELVMRIARRDGSGARMLTQEHGPGLFLGEHSPHVLAVNRREEELCEMLTVVSSK